MGIEFPGALAPNVWDKSKQALAKVSKPPATTMPEDLKKSSDRHDDVQWGLFSADKLDTVASVKERQESVEDQIKNKVSKVKSQVESTASNAETFVKVANKAASTDKQFPKDPAIAALAIAKAARAYLTAVDVFCAATRNALKTKLDAAMAKEKKAAPAAGAAKPGSGAAESLSKADKKFIGDRCRKAIAAAMNAKSGVKPATFALIKRAKGVQIVMGTMPEVAKGIAKLAKPVNGKKPPVLKDPRSQVIFEKGVLTLVSDKIPPKFSRLIQLALKELINKGPKVRMRRTTGEVEESGAGEDVDADSLKVVDDAVDPKEAAAAKADFERRWAKTKADVTKALPSRSPEEKAEIAGYLKDADAAAKKGDYVDALEPLEAIVAILDTTPTADEGDDAGGVSVDGLRKAKQGWSDSRKTAVTEITSLVKALLKAFEGEKAQQKDVLKAAGQLGEVSKLLNTVTLEKVLDEALAAKDAAGRARAAQKAKTTLEATRKMLNGNKIISNLDHNEIVTDMLVVQPMHDRLDEIAEALG
ncbi:MAG: hypothetical protein ABJA61_01950 [Caldimonas sp.]